MEIDEKFRNSLIILGLGILSFIFLIIGLQFEVTIRRVLSVIAISFAALTYIINLNEKRNGNSNFIGGIGMFIAGASGAVSIILIIESFN